ncbi:MAG: metallophosphoesterase [Ignavibacteriae bacterium]|nr:MAG: metallophosphoesterase [Ignavibacteriota bacterium]
MRIIIHISDLHFGKEVKQVEDALVEDINSLNPSLVVISGDFTQRARVKQYEKAAEYRKLLPLPQLVVPGNHDIPLFDIIRRIFVPRKRYKKYISEDLCPMYLDEEICVLGLDTTRAYKWKEGKISEWQIKLVQDKFCNVSEDIFKIIVTHHPFLPPPMDKFAPLLNQAALAIKVIDPCGIDMLLAGHLHHGYSGDVRTQYPLATRLIISVQAGTAISKRTRNEPNAYNVIVVDGSRLRITIRQFKETKFSELSHVDYTKDEKGWKIW